MEDMYVEDKSAGQKVFTDNFSRGDRGGRGGRGEDVKGRGKKPQERKYPQKKRISSPSAPKHEKDLSQLSMEERMAIYKKKYNRQGSLARRQPTDSKQVAGSREQVAGKQRSENRKYGKQQYNSKKKNNDYKQKPLNSSSAPSKISAPPREKKENILTKLKGLFKKK